MTTTFSIRFKQCLKEKNIKQAELARSTKITPSSISDWSKGKYVPKRDKLLAIAEFLEVNPDWLVGESDNMEITPLPTSTNNHINEDTEDLIDNISKLPILKKSMMNIYSLIKVCVRILLCVLKVIV